MTIADHSYFRNFQQPKKGLHTQVTVLLAVSTTRFSSLDGQSRPFPISDTPMPVQMSKSSDQRLVPFFRPAINVTRYSANIPVTISIFSTFSAIETARLNDSGLLPTHHCRHSVCPPAYPTLPLSSISKISKISPSRTREEKHKPS